MLPSEPISIDTRVHKLRPAVKPPVPAVLQSLSPAEGRRLKRLLSEPIDYVPHPLLASPDAADLLRRPLHKTGENTESDDSGVFHLLDLCESVRALERETFLFLRLNWCRKRLYEALQEQANRRLGPEAVRVLLDLEHAVGEVRGEIARENLPLVLAMAKRTKISGMDITDLISEGNLALLRAVNKFDCSRGYRFSTYACRAILKSFARLAARTSRRRGSLAASFDPALEKSDFLDRRRAATANDIVNELKAILTDNVARLSDVEEKVVRARFAIPHPREEQAQRVQTLEQVGQLIGVTKERVRQIQNRALEKLRLALEQSVLSK